jgi:beta-lactamase regulating signal transducer with metallopeptidase domain
MPPLLHIVLSNALIATALAVLVAIIAGIARRPALAHVLWLLVLLKLLTPGVISLPISWPKADDASSSTSDSIPYSPLAESSVSEASPLPASKTEEITVLILPADDESKKLPASSNNGEEALSAPSTGSWQTLAVRLSSIWAWFIPVWLTGTVVWLACATVQVVRFQRLLLHAQLAPADLQDQVKDWSGRLGLRKPPALWLVPGCVSPMLWTLGQSPRLLFPAKLLDRLDAEQRSALLIHELAHLRRRDHWVRFLEMAVMAVYWWHPILWWARRELHEAEEQCCDAWVVWALTSEWRRASCERAELREQPCSEPNSDSTRRAYALALLHTVDFFSHARPTLPASASGIGQVSHLRRRLTMIMNGNTPKSLSAAGWLAVLALGLLLPLVPVNAQQQSPSPQDERREPRDQQIEALKRVIQNLEEQRRAEHEKHRAEDKLFYLKSGDRLKQEQLAQQAQAEEQRAKAVRFLEEEMLAQSRDSEERRIHRLNLDEKASPEMQKAMRAMEEITRMMEAKRRELQELEAKLQQARADLERLQRVRAESAHRERREEIQLRTGGEAEIHREPIIIKVDPSANPEQIKAQVEAIQGKIKQPIRVEIVKPGERGDVIIRNRTEPVPDPRPRERREPRSERRESRSDDLEQKLERIMKEVEELRRELRESRK